MRLENKSLGFVVNFLLGVAWASALLGAVTSFLALYQISIFLGIISAVMGAVPGMVLVVLLEHVITAKERQLELQKQTALLEKLLEQKEKNDLQ